MAQETRQVACALGLESMDSMTMAEKPYFDDSIILAEKPYLNINIKLNLIDYA
jgi:hypothetical protein